MKRRSSLHFFFVGWILFFIASCAPSNQKEIVQKKEKVDLTVEDIVPLEMLDISSDRKKAFNKTLRLQNTNSMA